MIYLAAASSCKAKAAFLAASYKNSGKWQAFALTLRSHQLQDSLAHLNDFPL
jgi:hypothetical protein